MPTTNVNTVTEVTVGANLIRVTAGTAEALTAEDHGALAGLGDDDHPHYLTAARGDARYTAIAHATDTANPHAVTIAQIGAEAAGSAATAMTTHTTTYDHALLHAAVTAGVGIAVEGQQVTNSDTGSAAVAAHLLVTNPHSVTAAQTGAVPTTAIGAADGVASLDSTAKIPKAQLGTGTANSTNFLRGDGTWSTPSSAGAGITTGKAIAMAMIFGF